MFKKKLFVKEPGRKKKRRFKRILTRFNEMKRNKTGLKPNKVTKLVLGKKPDCLNAKKRMKMRFLFRCV
jgi:hypothetical protein